MMADGDTAQHLTNMKNTWETSASRWRHHRLQFGPWLGNLDVASAASRPTSPIHQLCGAV